VIVPENHRNTFNDYDVKKRKDASMDLKINYVFTFY